MLIGTSLKGSLHAELLTFMDPALTDAVPLLVFVETLTDVEPERNIHTHTIRMQDRNSIVFLLFFFYFFFCSFLI